MFAHSQYIRTTSPGTTFEIHQNNAAMKIGTDGILLGAWADCENKKNGGLLGGLLSD